MKSAVIINLDYGQDSSLNCRRIWNEIESRMLQAGFTKNNRLFLSSLDKDAACQQAKTVITEVDHLLSMENINAFNSIREFYGLEYQQLSDLLAPSNAPIEVSFLDTGTFRAFLPTTPE